MFPRRSVWIRHAGKPAFVADVHCVTLYNARQEYRRSRISADGDISDWFRINARLLADLLCAVWPGAENPDAPFRHDRLNAPARVCVIERALFHRIRTGELDDPLEIEETALALLFSLAVSEQPLPSTRVRTRRGDQRDLVQAARAALGATVTRNTSLSQVAAEVGCSPFHLCRTFRNHTGMTLHSYRDRLRLFLALDHILDRAADLTEAALHAGYSSHSHFTWAFRRTFGATPSTIRALAGAGRLSVRERIRRMMGPRDRAVPTDAIRSARVQGHG